MNSSKLGQSYLVLLAVLIAAVACQQKTVEGAACQQIENNERFDCFQEYGANEAACLQRGCCWRLPNYNHVNLTSSSNDENVPYCYYPKDFPSYQVVNYRGGEVYSLIKASATFRPKEILALEARVISETSGRLRVQIVDPSNDRYQVPVFHPKENSQKLGPNDDTDYQVNVNQNPFYIQVFRKSTGKLIFDTSVAPLIYADQYIEFSTSLTNGYFFGLGEHRDNFAHATTYKTFTLFNRDSVPQLNTNLYGTHPFYMSMEDDSNAFGFFLLNSNAMDVNVQPTPALTFITIGGILDFYIYLGPTPAEVIRQHTEVIGRSAFPQYWTLGFHLCRYDYNSAAELKKVINRTRTAGMPYDGQWTDIDAMEAKRDWTYDKENFAELPEIVDDLHQHGQHYVNIIDSAISNTNGYVPYESGLEADIFIKYEDSDEPLVGSVWPGDTVFPDFTNPNTTIWWTKCAADFYKLIPYDGLWIDMNEPSSFYDGSIKGCAVDSPYDQPPYTPKVLGGQLSSKTICMGARQYLSSHYNLHNMYGHFKAIATDNALKTLFPGKRPVILTRSSFAGTGQYAAHWSGDNSASWADLYYSIPNMLNFNMFGFSQIGSDICGFHGDTTEELCIRWMQLGSFYPFMRNHNDDTSKDQDPGSFSLDAQEAMRKALRTRYALLPYLYTLFYHSSTKGDTVVRPLFFEFANDKQTHQVDRQFMFGPAFLITPVLDPGKTSVQGYFPMNETWYRFETGQVLDNTRSASITLDTPLDEINVHMRAGYIVPFQFPEVTTTQSRKNPFGLVVALKEDIYGDSYAKGDLYWDDGESKDSIDAGNYNFFNFTASVIHNKGLTYGYLDIVRVNSSFETSMILSEIKVYGVSQQPITVTVDDQNLDTFVYDDTKKSLQIKYFSIDMNSKDTWSIAWQARTSPNSEAIF